MNATCPKCAAVYGVTDAHVGRRFACRKCGAGLLVTAAGLALADGGAPAEPLPAYTAVDDVPAARGDFGRLARQLRDIAALVLLGFGSLLAILFLFLPLTDAARIASRAALVESGDARKKAAEERAALQAQVDEARTDAKRNLAGYTWGMLVAMLSLAVGAMIAMMSNHPTLRRVGTVVLCGQVLLTFLAYAYQAAVRGGPG